MRTQENTLRITKLSNGISRVGGTGVFGKVRKKVPSLVAQTVENVPVMQETRVLSLSQEDLLEKGMATHSSIPAWRIPWAEEPGGLQSIGLQRVGHDWSDNTDSF